MSVLRTGEGDTKLLDDKAFLDRMRQYVLNSRTGMFSISEEVERLLGLIDRKNIALVQIISECDKWTFVPLEGIEKIAKEALGEV